jgi:hypothetical protein
MGEERQSFEDRSMEIERPVAIGDGEKDSRKI